MVIAFPLKLVDLKPGVERTNLGGVVSLGPPVGATTLAQAARTTTIANVVIIRFLLYAKMQKNKLALWGFSDKQLVLLDRVNF